MFELMLAMLREHIDPSNRIRILRSSRDVRLAEYFEKMGIVGSTHIDSHHIYIKIHDAGGATIGTWFEELGHALQYLYYGNVELSVDNIERCQREIEVAQYLLDHAQRLHLSERDRQHCRQIIAWYKKS